VRAFTWGSHVYLGPGERADDVGLLAHEVAHAIQQSGGAAVQLFDGPHGVLETEAHAAASTVLAGGRTQVRGRTSGPVVQGLFDWARKGLSAIGGAISSAASAVMDVGAALRDKLLGFVKDKAASLPGYDLLAFVLGRDPVTQQPVARTAVTLVRAVLGLVPGGQALFDNLQKANVIQRAFDWFAAETAKLGLTWSSIRALFARAWDELSLSDLASPSGAWEKLKNIFGPPLRRLADFAVAAGRKVLEFVFEGALALAGSAGQQILAIFRRAGAVFSLIVADPLKFLGNLLSAVKGGFGRFKDNILAHLRTGLFEWLLGSLEGVTLPKTWDFAGILHLVLEILGLTYTALRGVLVKLIGEPAVAAVEKAFDFLVLVITKGLGAAWDKIKEFATDLTDQVVGGIRDWVAKSVVGAAITKLVTMFNPVGAIIQGIITIYNTVMFFIERAKQIARLVNAVLDSVENIARGNLSAAIAYVERTMASTLPVILGFLGRLLGLGNVTKYVRDIITKIRTTIASALEKVGLWVKDKVKSLLAGKKAGQETMPPGTFIFERSEGGHTIRVRPDLSVARFSEPVELTGEEARKKQQEALESIVTRQKFSYPTDSLHRASGPSGHIVKIKEGEGRESMIGKGQGYLSKDHRGHLIGDRFGGSGSEVGNFVPMHPTLNLSTFKAWENAVADKAKNLASKAFAVFMKVVPRYAQDDAAQPSSFRPTHITGTATFITLKQGSAKLSATEEQMSSGVLSNPLPDIQTVNINDADITTLRAFLRNNELVSWIDKARQKQRFASYADLESRMTVVLGDRAFLVTILQDQTIASKITFR
jgi:hypothetical protein